MHRHSKVPFAAQHIRSLHANGNNQDSFHVIVVRFEYIESDNAHGYQQVPVPCFLSSIFYVTQNDGHNDEQCGKYGKAKASHSFTVGFGKKYMNTRKPHHEDHRNCIKNDKLWMISS